MTLHGGVGGGGYVGGVEGADEKESNEGGRGQRPIRRLVGHVPLKAQCFGFEIYWEKGGHDWPRPAGVVRYLPFLGWKAVEKPGPVGGIALRYNIR